MRDRNSVLSIYFYPFCVFHVADFFIICDRAKSSLPVKKQFFITRVLTRGPRPLLFMNLFFEVFVQYQGLWFCSLLLEGYNIQASHKRLCWMLIVSEKSLEEWKIKARIFENAKYFLEKNAYFKLLSVVFVISSCQTFWNTHFK